MSKAVMFGLASVVVGFVAVFHTVDRRPSSFAPDGSVEVKNAPPQAGPLCPWREPEADLRRFFPSATRYEAETRILSGQRLELARRLGRTPTGDENALRCYRIWRDTLPLGAVITRRVKGEYGVIEVVLGLDTAGRVCGASLQRWREPEAVASALQAPEWLGAFSGKSADDAWTIGGDLPRVPEAAQASAQAVARGTRDALVLWAVAEQSAQHR